MAKRKLYLGRRFDGDYEVWTNKRFNVEVFCNSLFEEVTGIKLKKGELVELILTTRKAGK